jgi:hypothetical protein
MEQNTKTCRKCGGTFPATIEFFHKSGNGLNYYCKTCRCDQSRTKWLDPLFRETQNKKTNERHNRRRILVLENYCGGKPHCQCCGENHIEFLSLDHVNGNGNKHRKEIGTGGDALLRYAVRNGFPPDLQVLCSNCNMAKSHYGECPHQREKREQVGCLTENTPGAL